jgi:hypothetical protein
MLLKLIGPLCQALVGQPTHEYHVPEPLRPDEPPTLKYDVPLVPAPKGALPVTRSPYAPAVTANTATRPTRTLPI